MAKKTTPKAESKAEEPVVERAPKFTPCRQCGYPADCLRAAKCVKGFK